MPVVSRQTHEAGGLRGEHSRICLDGTQNTKIDAPQYLFSLIRSTIYLTPGSRSSRALFLLLILAKVRCRPLC